MDVTGTSNKTKINRRFWFFVKFFILFVSEDFSAHCGESWKKLIKSEFKEGAVSRWDKTIEEKSTFPNGNCQKTPEKNPEATDKSSMKKQRGAVLFVMLVAGIIAIQSYRKKNSVQHEELASRSAPASACRYRPLPTPLTPQALQNFLTEAKTASIQDLVCCLPEAYRNNYVVMHSSYALQAGVPDNPRVLLYDNFNPDDDSKPKTILSITGSRVPVHGENHVEIMAYNPTEQKRDLFDVDFQQNVRQLEKNPLVCMGCHGPNPAEFQIAGAKPIFQEFPWPSTVGISLHLDDSQTKTYFQQAEGRALAALHSDPNYSCLKPKELNEMATNVNIYDDMIFRQNQERVYRIIRQSKDYQKFRPMLVGAALGCFRMNTDAPAESALDFFETEFPKWIPASVAEKLFVDEHTISPSLRQLDNVWEWYRQRIDIDETAELATRIQRRTRNPGREQTLFYPSKNFSSLYDDDIALNNKYSQYRTIQTAALSDNTYQAPPKSLAKYSKVTQLLARYAVDTDSNPHFTAGIDPYFRFIFEARGIPVVTWSREMSAGYGTLLVFPTEASATAESYDPFWQRNSRMDCDLLKEESYRNFTTNP